MPGRWKLKLTVDIVNLWMNRGLLLTAGTIEDCAMMTVAWGSIGYIWNKPFAQIASSGRRGTRADTSTAPTRSPSARLPEKTG